MRSAYLIAPLLACTTLNPDYWPSEDARAERPQVEAIGDSPVGPDITPATDHAAPADVATPPPDAEMEGDAPSSTDGVPGAGTPIAPGLVLYWRLDETTGSIAFDSSGHGFEGTYTGNPIPGPSAEAAPTTFVNAGSRQFDATVGHHVQLASPPAALRPTQGLTVTVWFRTMLVGRGDLVSHSGDYFIRYGAGELEFARRRPAGSSSKWVTASALAPTANDGRWHHAAGVASIGGGTSIYLDGTRIDHDPSPLPFTYEIPNTLFVGRSAGGGQLFDGWLDEVRIYDRALTAKEIQALAQGGP